MPILIDELSLFFPCHNEEKNLAALVDEALDALPALAARFEAINGIGDAGGMHLQSAADLAERQLPLPGEQQEHQHLEPAEGEAERLEAGIDARHQDLVHPHHRRDEGHALCFGVPALVGPVARSLSNGVEGQWRAGHGGES